MAQVHFVKEYEAHVAELIKRYPIDQAMSLAVGGLYREIGEIEENILRYAGLRDGMSLVDVGCGSGRLAHVLSESSRIEYLGTDIIQSLLDFAKTKCSRGYRFKLHRDLSIPVKDKTADMICAFSVFTHLLHEETYIYLEDMKRALKPGGTVVFSFLEFGLDNDLHWHIFEALVSERRRNAQAPLGMSIERSVIQTWCRHLRYELVHFVDGNASPHGAPALGQSVAILRNRT
jgi:ubiquinone/menaquinone biosynthesis C-methylase UbiE